MSKVPFQDSKDNGKGGEHQSAYPQRIRGPDSLGKCPEGYGEETFKSWMHSASRPQDLLERIQREFVLGGHKAAAVAAVQARVSVYVVSSWPHEEMRQIGLTPFNDPQSALDVALAKLGTDSKVIVLPLAGSTIPKTA